MVAKILEVISETSRNYKGKYFKLVWDPWFDHSNNKPIMYTKPDSMTKVVENLAFRAAKELTKKAYFNHKP